ncbi:MAG: hypothetical protein KC613_10690 [Myxococcales bacterium]|nr:hypothetical protein [Myxococcales bacterium]
MRKLMALSSLALLTTACWGPVEQTSPQPFTSVPAQARSKEVKALCKEFVKADSPLCKGMDKIDEKQGHGDHH